MQTIMSKNITDFEFRPVNEQLIRAVQQFHFHLFGPDDAGYFGSSFLEKLLEGRSYRCLILFEKNKPDIVAISCFQTYGYIYSFGVHKNYRRIGLGKFILKCTIECIIDMECIEASLNVNTTNTAAIKLYKSCGFNIRFTISGFYGNSDPEGPDAHDMQMRLPPEKRHKNTRKPAWRNFSVKEWNLIHRINGLLVY
eukprot:93901_1